MTKSGERFEIKSKPASCLVNLITNCDFSPDIIMPEIKNVLKDFDLKNTGALIIGCTHFYHITDFLAGYLNDIPIIEPAKIAVSCLNDIINDKKLSKEDTSHKGITRCYVSGELEVFKERVKTLEAYHKRTFIDEFLRPE